VIPNDDLEYYLSAPHWLDALLPPLENHLERLKGSVKALLQMGAVEAPAPVAFTPVNKDSPSQGPAKFEGQGAVPARREIISAQTGPQNRWMLALVAAVVICAILLGLLLLQLNNRPKTEARSRTAATATATPVATVVQPPFQSPVTRREPEQPRQAALVKGVPLFSHNFETASPIIRPLFGPTIMSVRNANGEGHITGKSAGILPAMFDKFLLDDFIVECDMRAEDIPPGARYGFIFRAADVRNGGIARYYALMFDPNQSVAAMSWWMETKWMMNAEQPVPAELLQIGRKSRITLEASGNRLRAFVDEHFVAEFYADGLKDGRIGLCLAGANTQPWTVHFDNFEIFLPPKNLSASAASTAGHAVTNKPFQRSWDFSVGMLADIRSEGVELVDAKIWNLPGGKHVRFFTGGVSWLEATFEVPDGAELPTRLTVRHLSSSPGDDRLGFSPVRITLNGNEIFRGSPPQKGWMDEQIDLGRSARPGTNRLRWDYLDGAQTHYWLK
jgi:hypothetical protein